MLAAQGDLRRQVEIALAEGADNRLRRMTRWPHHLPGAAGHGGEDRHHPLLWYRDDFVVMRTEKTRMAASGTVRGKAGSTWARIGGGQL
jgi:hypothetical protein